VLYKEVILFKNCEPVETLFEWEICKKIPHSSFQNFVSLQKSRNG